MKCEDLEKVVIGDNPERFFQVGAQLPLLKREKLVEFLRKNVEDRKSTRLNSSHSSPSRMPSSA